MVLYEKKMASPEECGSTAWEDDFNYKNTFSFYMMENYQNFLESCSQNHFINNGTKSVQDDVYDILYGQLPDQRWPLENTTPKEINTTDSTEQTIPNCYCMPAVSEFRQPQTEERDQNDLCLPFPMDLSRAYLQNSGSDESEDAYPCLNSAYHASEFLQQTSSVPSASLYPPPAYGELKNSPNDVFRHSTKDQFPNTNAVFSDVVYSKTIEILRENPKEKFQTVSCLEPSVKASNSLNSFKDASKDITVNKDITTNNYNFLPSNSRVLSSDTEKYCHNNCENPPTSQNLSFSIETAASNSKQFGADQRTENFERVLASLKNCLLPDFSFSNFKDLPLDFADISSNAKANPATDMSATTSKNGNLHSQNKFLKENLHLHNKANGDMFLTPENPSNTSKHSEHILKRKSYDGLELVVKKKSKTDLMTIPSVSDSSKQIPTVNIAIHQIPNNYPISPNDYMNQMVPNTQRISPVAKKNLNRIGKKPTKTLTSKKSLNKMPVSIRARNAKFLCDEKDLRGRTVRELLETCEIIQNKINSKAKTNICMNVSTNVLTRDSSELTLPILPSQTDCLNNLSKNGDVYKGSNHMKTTSIQTLPKFQDHKIGIHLPIPKMSNLRNLSPTNVSFPDSVKIYQPMVDSWKTVKVTKAKKNCFKAKHFDFNFLQIRNFKYFCNDSDEKRTSKLKLIFSKQKLMYEFQLRKTFDTSGGYVKHLAMIEIKFGNIVAMWGYRNEIRLEVDEPPHMYVGTRYCNKDQQFGPHQNAQYDRSRTTDLTLGELYQVPFHYIRLHKTCVNKILPCLSRFNSHFEQMLKHPLIEDSNKLLAPLQLIAPMLPIRINKSCSQNDKLQTNKQEMVLIMDQNNVQPKRTNIEQHAKSYVRELRPCPQRLSL